MAKTSTQTTSATPKKARNKRPLTLTIEARAAKLGLKPNAYLERAVNAEIANGAVARQLKEESDRRFAELLPGVVAVDNTQF